MTPDLPDLAGFRDAQIRLVEVLGNDCTFYFAASAATYPPGTAIDPETMKPLDPMVQPSSYAGPAPISVRATVVDRLGMGRDYGDLERAGLIPQGNVILRIPTGATDYTAGIIYSRQFQTMAQTYRTLRYWFDGDGGVVDRLMVVGELTDGLDPALFSPPPAQQVIVGPLVTEVYDTLDGQTIFPVQLPFVATTTDVHLDGIYMTMGVGLDYVESGQAIIFDDPTTANQRLTITYTPS